MKPFYTFILLFSIKSFVIQGQNVNFTSSNLPILKINTNGKTIFNEPKILADMQLIYNGRINAVSDKPTGYLDKTGIEFRDSTSQQLFPKKPYGFELWVNSTMKNSII